MAHKILDDWDTIGSLLPANWEQLAVDHKQLLVQHGKAKITNAGDLLRLILVHAAADAAAPERRARCRSGRSIVEPDAPAQRR
jgi:hypothetical protein